MPSLAHRVRWRWVLRSAALTFAAAAVLYVLASALFELIT